MPDAWLIYRLSPVNLILLLFTITALQHVITACDLCDPDVPSKPLPPQPVRGKRANNPRCGAGRFFNEMDGECQECQPGHFMTENMATKGYTLCWPCTKADDASVSYEVEAEPCKSTRDTLILCIESFFRKKITYEIDNCSINCNFACTRCNEVCGTGLSEHLDHEGQSCSGFHDRICCKYDDMIVVNNKCTEPQLTTVRPSVDQSTTTQRWDTGATRPNENTLPTTKATTDHKRSCFGPMFASVTLVILACFLSLSSH